MKCRYCENPNAILTKETCCTGCSALEEHGMRDANYDKLCPACKEFDYIMNRQDGVSFDVMVICEHEKGEKNET